MSTPQRIQRQRTKGWRTPPNTIYIGRPTKYGNPFQPDGPEQLGYDLAVNLYQDIATGIWTPQNGLSDQAYTRLYDSARLWRRRIGGHPLEVIRSELRGRNLSCWCQLDEPCHGSILLKLANS